MPYLYYCTGEVETATGVSVETLKVNALDRTDAIRQARAALRERFAARVGRVTAVRIDRGVGSGGSGFASH